MLPPWDHGHGCVLRNFFPERNSWFHDHIAGSDPQHLLQYQEPPSPQSFPVNLHFRRAQIPGANLTATEVCLHSRPLGAGE